LFFLLFSKFVFAYGLESIGDPVLKDKRNFPNNPQLVLYGTWPLLLLAWAYSRYRQHGLELWVIYAYHVLRMGPRFRFFAWFHVMAHKEGHDYNGFFKGPLSLINHSWITWYALVS
jgi:hypothetical protein